MFGDTPIGVLETAEDGSVETGTMERVEERVNVSDKRGGTTEEPAANPVGNPPKLGDSVGTGAAGLQTQQADATGLVETTAVQHNTSVVAAYTSTASSGGPSGLFRQTTTATDEASTVEDWRNFKNFRPLDTSTTVGDAFTDNEVIEAMETEEREIGGQASLNVSMDTLSIGVLSPVFREWVAKQTKSPDFLGQQQSEQPASEVSFGVSPTLLSAAETQLPGGTTIPFVAYIGEDEDVKGGVRKIFNVRYQAICAMKEYETRTFEELRWGDYQVNRKGPQGIANDVVTSRRKVVRKNKARNQNQKASSNRVGVKATGSKNLSALNPGNKRKTPIVPTNSSRKATVRNKAAQKKPVHKARAPKNPAQKEPAPKARAQNNPDTRAGLKEKPLPGRAGSRLHWSERDRVGWTEEQKEKIGEPQDSDEQGHGNYRAILTLRSCVRVGPAVTMQEIKDITYRPPKTLVVTGEKPRLRSDKNVFLKAAESLEVLPKTSVPDAEAPQYETFRRLLVENGAKEKEVGSSKCYESEHGLWVATHVRYKDRKSRAATFAKHFERLYWEKANGCPSTVVKDINALFSQGFRKPVTVLVGQASSQPSKPIIPANKSSQSTTNKREGHCQCLIIDPTDKRRAFIKDCLPLENPKFVEAIQKEFDEEGNEIPAQPILLATVKQFSFELLKDLGVEEVLLIGQLAQEEEVVNTECLREGYKSVANVLDGTYIWDRRLSEVSKLYSVRGKKQIPYRDLE